MIAVRLLGIICILTCLGGCETVQQRQAPEPHALNEAHEESMPSQADPKAVTPPVSPPPPPPKVVSPAQSTTDTSFGVVKVFFATDRSRSKRISPNEMFGSGRAGLTYGSCLVSIPRDHRMGALEAPSILKGEFRPDPAKHVMLRHVEIKKKEEFYADIAMRVRASSGKKAFIFVHGYNVKFDEAAKRTAQIAYDLGFDGAPIFYSWPSRGVPRPLAYTADEQNIEWSQANLKRFLEEFFIRSDAQNVHLIAHSMGNRALTRAISTVLRSNPSVKERLKEIILTATDIDAEVFRRDIAPVLAASGRPVTLYASSNDLALVMSKKVHGYPRAGDSGAGLVIAAGIETIDASNTDTSFLGHSYYAERRSILADMFYVITEGRRADNRFGLQKINTGAGPYWVFRK